MKILFVYSSLPKGGIETFFVRIAKKLSLEKVNITFLFLSRSCDENLRTELEKYATLLYLDDYLLQISLIKWKSLLQKLLLPIDKKKFADVLEGVTHIHAPDFTSLLFANKFLLGKKKIPISTGLYHINEFNFEGQESWFFAKAISKYLRELPATNIIFFNEISNQFYNKKFRNKFESSIITPIGVNLLNSNTNAGVQNNRIVSVGRLTSWKTYNYHMIEVVNHFRKNGVVLNYDSYGDGEERNKLERKILELDLQEQVKFNNEIDYKDFEKTIQGHLMFIGAGTALIEASSFGIPSLIGIENGEDPLSYGFLHDTAGYSYQEKQLNLPTFSIISFISSLIDMSSKDYEEECQLAKSRAQDFSIDKTLVDFMQLFQKSVVQNYYFDSRFTFFLILFSLFLNKIFNPKSNYSKRL